MQRVHSLRVSILAGLAAIALGTVACGKAPTELDFDGICSGPPPVVARVDVQPAQVNLRIGHDAQIQALPVDAQGGWVLCANLQYSSANPAVATVSASGLVSGVSAGKTYIRAASGGKADSVAINVVATTIGSVVIESAPASLLIAQTAQLKLVARDTDGNVITPVLIIWRVVDPAVATISELGMLTAHAEGTAAVTLVAEGLTATALIPVTRDAPTRRFRQIAAGFMHTCALAGGGGIPEGTAFCWGDGTGGQLGVGGAGFTGAPLRVSGGQSFASIAAGNNSSCAVTASGDAYCWGRNETGQLGDGTTVDRTVPTRVATTLTFRSVALGGEMTCGLTADGAVYCWGQVGTARARPPTLLPGGIQFSELTAAGGGFVCGRTSAGRAYCWGSSYTWAGAAPTAPGGNLLFSQISASDYHVCGVAISDGLGYCWGRLDGRPLGRSIPEGTRETPVAIPGGLRFSNIAAGGSFTCGVTSTGSFCLGGTYLDNSDNNSPTPIPREDRMRFATISGGSFHACAIDTAGGAWCWGRNYEGQVGAGEFNTIVSEPLQLRIP
jgi:alpha-tubulin suppressor-like RCC1 family protein